jgi:uncharacterized membrane protein
VGAQHAGGVRRHVRRRARFQRFAARPGLAENIVFTIVWFCLGLLFATLIYSVSVVSMPMILHRRTDAITAGLTSMRLVLTQTAVMMWWAALITGLVLLALLPWFAGMLVIGPVLGHASWHAYRATVVD